MSAVKFEISGRVSDQSSSKAVISTGLGFLDHMIDQIRSHGQFDIKVSVDADGYASESENKHDMKFVNRFAELDQTAVMSLVGELIGGGLRRIYDSVNVNNVDKTYTFSCPLDESLVEVSIQMLPSPATHGELKRVTLAPYGTTGSKKTGRLKIGQTSTFAFETFFASVAREGKMVLTLDKIRGKNAHHIVESSFKAFSRCMRNVVDNSSSNFPGLTLVPTPIRVATTNRSTKETKISVAVALDGKGTGQVATGLDTMDTIVNTIQSTSGISISVDCSGDLWIDDHHSSEDVAIAIGQVLKVSLGDKGGLNRMWSAVGTQGDVKVECVMDLSNRPHFEHDLCWEVKEEEMVGDLSVEMMDHVFDSIVMNAGMTVHFRALAPACASKTCAPSETPPTFGARELMLAAAKAFGQCLQMTVAVDARRAGKTASSKGTLSV